MIGNYVTDIPSPITLLVELCTVLVLCKARSEVLGLHLNRRTTRKITDRPI